MKNEVASEILNQLGGNKFLVMTGVKNLQADDHSLNMKLTTNKIKAQYLKITLTVMDTYTVKFYSVDKYFNHTVKKEVTGVYADMLRSIFTEVTGLHTSLGTMRAA